MIASPPPVHPWPIGVGPRYQPTAYNAQAAAGRTIHGMQCRSGGRTFAVHIELFANRNVIIVPKGIGMSRRRCTYPLRTAAPTGVVEVKAARPRTLGDLFRVWGRTLNRRQLLTFHGTVSVFVNGKRTRRKPQDVVLTKHLQVVVEIGGYVAPHPHYLFPKGAG
jgi:hypothetical protein